MIVDLLEFSMTKGWGEPGAYGDRRQHLLQSGHDLFLEEIERGDHFFMGEVADVEHAHEVVGADLLHLLLDLLGNAVGGAGD